MSKHTPGPWEAFQNDLGCGVLATKRADVAYCWTRDGWPLDSSRPISESVANARLIAAAPELLEALKEVSAEARHPDYDWNVALLKTVRAAIAKAEGVKP